MPMVRLPGGSLRDQVRQPIYDTITIGAGVSPVGVYRFFSNIQGKSRAQTNLRQANLLETAVSFRTLGLDLDAQNFYSANVGALPVIMENSSLKFRVGEKDYWEGTMTFIAGRIEPHFAAALFGQAAPTVVNYVYQKLGSPAVAPVTFDGKHCIDINPLQTFFIEWTCDNLDAGELTLATPAQGTKMKFIGSLKGLLRRPVQ